MHVGADEGIGGGLCDQMRDAPLLRRLPPFEQRHHLPRHQGENLGLVRGEGCAGGGVDHAQCPDPVPARQHQRRACVKADVRIAGHQRIASKARVGGGIGHDHYAVLIDRVPAERDASAGLARRQTMARLEPLAVGIDQADQRSGRREAVGGQLYDHVELVVARCAQNVEAMQRGEPLWLVRRNRGRGKMRLGHGGRRSGQNGAQSRSLGCVTRRARAICP